MTTETSAQRRVAASARRLDTQLVEMARRVNAPVQGVPSSWVMAAGVAAVGLLVMPATWRKRVLSVAGFAVMRKFGGPLP